MAHIKNLKAQGTNVVVDEDKINDLINKISDKKDERSKYIDLEFLEFLDKHEYTNIYVRYNKNKKKSDTEEITRSLKKSRNKLINFSEFNEEYDKFMDDFTKFEYYKSEKEPGNKPQLGNVMSKKGEGLKILNNKQMLNRLPILLAQIEAGNNSNKLKNETRQILYSLYRSKALTKTVYNKLIRSIHA